ncbi:MAG TPA: cytochrome C oxidase subunit IV family protein [Thermoanaerobaculia bacterium]|jgi:cytochrome c oxidase subunit 4|nr:cytochrome C oxidase subunit IV family protein [Thermoanaerobaculia bacterium]
MSASDVEAIRKQTRTYIGVFIALMIGTILTVAVSYFHLPIALAILVALVIASFKGSLVAAFFMHLAHERKVIYWVLILTVAFFIALMFIPSLTQWDQRNLR